MTDTLVPALSEPRPARSLRSTVAVLDGGLRVTAVRKPGVPLVELRLRVPFLSARTAHSARSALLADTLLTGARGLDRAGFAAAIQGLGASLHASANPDRLLISGNVLATQLGRLLELLAAVLTEPTFARDDVATERERLVEKLTIARARPGGHPAKPVGTPEPVRIPEVGIWASEAAAWVQASRSWSAISRHAATS